ncbi:hypothetical protein ACFO25_17095 [Paenactinomyces guangxiensis]|uniref:Uncharacterized protein n=1 Tax=Paenactinomyces guangxiensis TaxID=1490290 RepID=A0A7W1WUC2_9BACL|nr:hypothetical protein [Paenactinomyces guangxiensis]MBA4496206.1 hypothetical protein [Paenactinomyces guangxiensis]MBH8593295.1 hypothetical protein [Paenactinomyces guangxiensis]
MKKNDKRETNKEVEKHNNTVGADGTPTIAGQHEDAIRSEKLRYENADEIYK